MPAKGKDGEFAPLPSTLERSPKKAQDTYEQTLESAEKTYDGDEERAHRAAWASVKHSFEKVGDHWEPKDHKGPSDPRAARSADRTATRRRTAASTSKARRRTNCSPKRASSARTRRRT